MKHNSRYPKARPIAFLFGLIILGSLVSYAFYEAWTQTELELKTAQGSVQNLIAFYWDAEHIDFDPQIIETPPPAQVVMGNTSEAVESPVEGGLSE